MAQEALPTPKYIDVRVGTRVALRRRECKMTQSALATALGITEPELRAKESGKDRFAPAELLSLAKALDTRPGWFFESLGTTVKDTPFED